MKSIRITCTLLCLAFLHSCTMRSTDSRSVPSGSETVILLHGLLHNQLYMKRMEKSLADAGYQVINFTYPARKYTIEQLAEGHLGGLLSGYCQDSTARIHFVTHSFGGVVLRYYLQHHDLPNLGRVVMLSPPNRGTELVDRWKKNPLFRLVNGPAGLQMGTDEHSLPAKLGPVDFEGGVITGNRSLNPFASRYLPGPDDGVVAVERTRVDGLADFLVLPYSHTFIMMHRQVIKQVINFLQHGAFSPLNNKTITSSGL